MKKLALSLLSLFLVLVAGQSLSAQDEKFTIPTGYAPGTYEKVVECTIDIATPVAMKNTQMRCLTIEAAERNADGSQQIVAKFTRESTKSPFGNYDSGNHDADNNTPIKQPGSGIGHGVGPIIVGLKITTLYDKNGKPIKSEGADEFFKKLEAVYGSKEAVIDVKTMMVDESGQITADSSLRFNGIRLKMPNAPVAIGETWKTEVMMDNLSMGTVKANVENTLTEVKTENGRKIAVIASKVAHHSNEPLPLPSVPNYKITMVDIRADSIASVDIESGLILKITTDADIACETNVGPKLSHKVKTTVTGTAK
jgi:hypothetical protein